MGTTTFSGPVVSQGGFIDASFTTAERDAIVSPQPGLLIYNTTENNYQVYTGTVWDSAFGGGGGGGAFPYSLSFLRFDKSIETMAIGSKASKVLFNPTGTQALTSANYGMNVAALTTPYNLNTFSTFGEYPTSYKEGPLGAFYNADGTKVYIAVVVSGSSVQIFGYDLSFPYDLFTLNTSSELLYSQFTAGNMMFGEAVRSFDISQDGTKLMFAVRGGMGETYLRTFTMSSPYNFASINGTTWTAEANVSSYVNALHYMTGSAELFGLAVDSAGTTVYTSVLGYVGTSYPGLFALEFKLGTAFDVNSIQTTYSQLTQAPTDVGNYNCGIALANNDIYIGCYNMMSGGPSYEVSSLTAVLTPKITNVSPSSGVTSSLVTITGSGFSGTTSIKFGSATVSPTSFSVINDSEIQVQAPATNTNAAVDVEVTNPAGSSTKVAAFTNTSPPATTYTSGVDYGYAGFNGMGTSGSLMTQSMDAAMITAFQGLNIGDTIVADYGSVPATLTVTGSPTFQGPGAGDWDITVSSDSYLMGTSFASLTF